MLQVINEIIIFAKTIKELCIKKPGRKRKEIQKVKLIRKIAEIIMRKTTIEKVKLRSRKSHCKESHQ